MQQFTFRLEHVARFRIGERDKRRGALAEAARVVGRLESERNQIRRELRALHDANREASRPGSLDTDYLRRASEFERQLWASQTRIDDRCQVARRHAESCRHALLDAERDVKALEKLRERQSQAHEMHATRVEVQRLEDATRRRPTDQIPALRDEESRANQTGSFGWG